MAWFGSIGNISNPPEPTPSGADGLTYDLDINGGDWSMTVTEYNNGVQTNQEVFDVDDVASNPATFGDLIITGVGDYYMVKPNYVDGKSIKYNDVLYSGDNAIEFSEGDTYLPAYSTQSISNLIGWVE